MAFNKQRITKLDIFKILVILALAFYITYIPHQNYPYPVHGDEWVHLAYSEAMLQAGSTTFNDPFWGESTLDTASNLETGFHLFWVVFRLVTDISWLAIFRYFPGIIFMITVLMVYIFAEREGFGFEAALFTCLIPTTVGILGPALLVPVAMGLIFIPLSFYISFNFKTWPSYLLLCIITIFLLIMHPPSAVILLTIFVPYALLNVRCSFRHSLGTTLALVIPFVASFIWLFDLFVYKARQLLTSQPYHYYVEIPSLIQAYGYIPIAFSFFGTVLLLIKGGKKNYGLIFGLLALSLLLVIFFRFHYGLPVLYERGLMYLMLILAIIAGAGLAWMRMVRFPSKSTNVIKSFFARNVGGILCLVIIIVALVIGISFHKQAFYHHLINDEDYQAFVWIRDNLDERYRKAVLDPRKATAFTAITQKNIYTRIHGYPKTSDMKAYDFLGDRCSDTSFLRENGISIVYSQWDCDNPDLIEVRSGVYVLSEIEGK